jgi:hypothetical protein
VAGGWVDLSNLAFLLADAAASAVRDWLDFLVPPRLAVKFGNAVKIGYFYFLF